MENKMANANVGFNSRLIPLDDISDRGVVEWAGGNGGGGN